MFIRAELLPGSSSAARNALSLAAQRGDIVRIRAGLYYKGAISRYGMTRPSTGEIAREVLGTEGVGPASFSASRFLGLTTQMPAEFHVAITGPVPESLAGIRVHRRNNQSRIRLTQTEIALLEVLRDPATLVESGWGSLESAAIAAVKRGDVRPRVLDEVVPKEGSLSTRRNFAQLRNVLTAA